MSFLPRIWNLSFLFASFNVFSLHSLTSDLGQGAQILRFSDSRIQLRRSDGATITENVPPYAQVLYRYVSKNEWDNGVRLCRFVKVRVISCFSFRNSSVVDMHVFFFVCVVEMKTFLLSLLEQYFTSLYRFHPPPPLSLIFFSIFLDLCIVIQ